MPAEKKRPKHDLKLVLLAFIAVAAVWAVLTFSGGKNENVYLCNYDSDCISAGQGCCDCNMGGKATAINKNYESLWNSKISSECGQRACRAVISNDPSCYAKPKCVSGLCKLA
ncbi:MAG: hypothetical protein HY051_03680 [Candidatus Aenigmarchaeota archaeon]|nr:hypothetical protein [Candidatus Aenigmarchaeota archaeon]